MNRRHEQAAAFAAELELLRSRMQLALEQAARLQPIAEAGAEREVVYREDSLTLYYYGGTVAATAPPLLIVYSLVNRPQILDLQPDRSLIRSLRDAGHPVYLIDWGYPEPIDRFLTLDDYVNGYLHRCIERIRRRHDRQPVNLLGVCQGGNLALCYAALQPQRVARLVSLITPVDFHAESNALQNLARHVDIDALVDTFGNIPAHLLNAIFVGLKPYRLLSQRYVEMPALAEDPQGLSDFLRMERWMYDSPDQAGEAYRQYAKEFCQENRLIRGDVQLGGRTVRLEQLTMPILNVFASDDHLVPAASARALRTQVPAADYNEIEFPGGHLSVFTSGRAQRELYPALARWLQR